MGSKSDYETLAPAVEILREFQVPYEAKVVSAHRTPDLLFEFASHRRKPRAPRHHCGSGARRISPAWSPPKHWCRCSACPSRRPRSGHRLAAVHRANAQRRPRRNAGDRKARRRQRRPARRRDPRHHRARTSASDSATGAKRVPKKSSFRACPNEVFYTSARELAQRIAFG